MTDIFIIDLYRFSESVFSDVTVHHTKLCLLDYLGVTIAGYKELDKKTKYLYSEISSSENGKISLIGTGLKTGLLSAIFLNGIASHVLELDDGIRYGALHPGAPVISALLPYAQNRKLSGKGIIKGIITGYETAIRIAWAMQPGHYDLGYHPTGTCGGIGAAAGIIAAIGKPRDQMKTALGCAAISASGTLKVIEDGSDLKPLNIANAAINGYMSAVIACSGFEAPKDPMGGESGFFNIMTDHINDKRLFGSIDGTPLINKVYFKTYAACRHSHTAIEAALEIRNNPGFNIDEIDQVVVSAYDYVIGKHDHTEICGVSSAKMSIPFCVAAALLKGSGSHDIFVEKVLSDEKVMDLTRKVRVIAVKELSDLVPEKRPAILEVWTKSGHCFKKRIDYPKGEPENPLTDDELIQKFMSLALYSGKSTDEAERIVDCVLDIENRIDELYALL